MACSWGLRILFLTLQAEEPRPKGREELLRVTWEGSGSADTSQALRTHPTAGFFSALPHGISQFCLSFTIAVRFLLFLAPSFSSLNRHV